MYMHLQIVIYIYNIYLHPKIKQNRKAGCKSQIQLRSGPDIAGRCMQEYAL